MDELLVYGSYGYTGSLIAREAVSRGGSPIIAGRDPRRVAAQADDLGVDWLAFDVADAADHLEGFNAVLNCAGPFVDTADPMVEACLETGTDYLDVTGEFQVFERLAKVGERAQEAGVRLLPGVGFDVVPSDCLAAHLADRLPSADELAVGLAHDGSFSQGTILTLVNNAGEGGVIRRNGRLIRVPAAYDTREIDFGSGSTTAVTVPMGDVVTAAHSTGIENVSVYAAASNAEIAAMRVGDSVDWLVAGPVQSGLERLIEAGVDGPDEAELEAGRAVVWAELTDGERTVSGRVRTPNVYALTADAAVSAAERTLAGDPDPGFGTPATAFGPDFVLDLEGTEREVVHVPERVEP